MKNQIQHEYPNVQIFHRRFFIPDNFYSESALKKMKVWNKIDKKVVGIMLYCNDHKFYRLYRFDNNNF